MSSSGFARRAGQADRTLYVGRELGPEAPAGRLGQAASNLTLVLRKVESFLGKVAVYTRANVEGRGYREDAQLRVLIANEREDRLESLAAVVAALGHDVIAREVDVDGVARAMALEQPDVAVVSLGRSSRHALALIGGIVGEATCPVIALTHASDREFVRKASRLGVFAVVADHPVEDLESSIEVGLRRFGDYHELEAALRRRALTERAKGILMERHSIDEAAAFDMLRHHSRTTNRKLVDTALAVLDGHPLLPTHAPAAQH